MTIEHFNRMPITNPPGLYWRAQRRRDLRAEGGMGLNLPPAWHRTADSQKPKFAKDRVRSAKPVVDTRSAEKKRKDARFRAEGAHILKPLRTVLRSQQPDYIKEACEAAVKLGYLRNVRHTAARC